jgi:hypothetical protein
MPTFNLLGLEIYIPDLDEIIAAVTSPLQQALAAVQTSIVNTLSPLFNVVTSTLSAAISSVTSGISNLFSGSLTWITDKLSAAWDVLSGIWAQISTAMGDLWTSISSGLSALQTALTDTVNGISNALSGALSAAQTVLSSAITSAESSISGGLAAAGSAISGALETAQTTLMDAFDGMGNAISGTIGGILSGFGSVDLSAVMSSHTGGLGFMASAIVSLGAHHSPITPEDALAWTQPFIDQVTAAATSLHVANIVAEAASLGQIDVTLEEVWDYPQTKAAMALAGELSALPIKEGLEPALKRYILKSYVPNIPDFNSLMSIYVKEGYLEDHWVEMPPEMAQNFAELGYSIEWAQKLWGQHWQYPNPQQLYEMLHRTAGDFPEIGVTEIVLKEMLKLHDYEPKWRGPLEAISWNTWRLLDIRTGWEMGFLDDEAVVKHLIDRGYEPKDARLVADVQKLTVLRSEIDALVTQTIDDYVAGWISEDQLRADLEATPYQKDVIELRVSKAKIQRNRALKKDLKTALENRYLKSDLAEAEFKLELGRLGLTQEWITSEVARIQAQKLKTVKEDTTTTTKALTEAQYSRAYRVGLIPEDQYRKLLQGLKIGQDDIDLLAQLNTPEKPSPEEMPTLTLGELKAAFRVGVIDENEFRSELAFRMYSIGDIDTIVATEKTRIKPPVAE